LGAGQLWVTVRHEIDYTRPAFLDDEVIARTWIGECSERHVSLQYSGFSAVRPSGSLPLTSGA